MKQADPQRRHFLLALGLGGAGAAAALLAGKRDEPATPVAAAPETPPQARGYQLSEHVRTYYRTTRI